MIKVLNLYSGIGGNRKLWEDVDVVAIENNKKIAKVYQEFFPDDLVFATDAHQFLLENFKEYDFIWSSPPCPTHSKFRFMATKIPKKMFPIKYPDMKLYQEIILLKHYFEGKWVVENVKGYYKPLIKPQEISRHYFWSNFITSKNIHIPNRLDIKASSIKNEHFDLTNLDVGHRKDQILNNTVEPELGLHVFNSAFKDKQQTLV